MSAQLELKHINKNFGGLRVINDLSFVAQPGQITSLIGPNGAGKTTLLNLISGIYQPDDGDILFDGVSIVGLEPHEITQRGIARTFQTLRLFLNMSIIENVMSASFSRAQMNLIDIVFRTPRFRREEQRLRNEAEEKLGFFGSRLVGYRFDQPAYSLSYANRRRLEIARAMMTNPKILLLDEPAAGMNPNETLEVTALIGQLRDEAGYTIILIEHDMSVVGGISDHVIVLDHGEKIAEGDFEDVVTDERVVEAYLGRKSS
ncbi:MAG: ABC transporter ATP-binding protein [Chloroflexi bacterium]|nr:MAG: ABC transporter ATP-binding protein [Chloroflexota bacterium]